MAMHPDGPALRSNLRLGQLQPAFFRHQEKPTPYLGPLSIPEYGVINTLLNKQNMGQQSQAVGPSNEAERETNQPVAAEMVWFGD